MSSDRSAAALPTARHIAEALRRDIDLGRLPAGAALRQEELAARFGVSRLPVREALAHLEAEGLLVVHPNRGAFVTAPDADEVRELFDLRVLIETDLLARAAAQLTERELRRLEVLQQQLDLEDQPEEWLRLDRDFHHGLYAPAARPHSLALAASLRARVNRFYRSLFRPNQHAGTWGAEHRAILAALRHGDPDAAQRALRAHLEHTATLTLASLQAAPEV